MTLDRFRSVADRALDPFVAGAAGIGLTPNSVSVVAFLLAVGAGIAYLFAGSATTLAGVLSIEGPAMLYLLGAVFVFFNGWLDLLDGALARELGVDSDAGDLLDHVLDRYADIVIIAGLAGGVGRYALGLAAITGVLMTSYLGTQAQAVGLNRVYGGLVGRADRLALVGVVTAVAPFYPVSVSGLTLVGLLLVFFAVIGHFTALQRFYHSYTALE